MFSLKIFGVDVKLCFSFIAVFCLVSFFDGTSYILLGMAVCMLHECGHILAMCVFNVPPEKVQLYGAGIKITENTRLTTFSKEVIILSAGIITNFILFVVCYFTTDNFNINLFGMMNLIIGMFNCIPFKFSDGGRLVSMLIDRYSKNKNNKAKTMVKWVTVTGLCIAGTVMFLKSKGNISLLVSIIYIVGSEIFL